MKLLLIMLGYVACGIYAWGTTMAMFKWDDKRTHLTSRDNAGISALMALWGPMGALVSALASNFNQHGWELW